MRISYISGDKIVNLNLPQRVWGNYWIQDSENLEAGTNIVNIKARQGQWEMTSNQETSIIYNNVGTPSVVLNYHTFYTLKEASKTHLSFIYTSKVLDDTYTTFRVAGECDLRIGRSADADIIYNNLNIGEANNSLMYRGSTWVLKDLNSRFGTFVNNKKEKEKVLENGDVIFIMGLKIIIMGDKLVINNPLNSVKTNTHYLVKEEFSETTSQAEVKDLDPSYVKVYEEDDYFVRSPRFRTNVQPTKIKIDSPPAKKESGDRPAILVIGPALTMSMMSLMRVVSVLENLQQGASFGSVAPRLFTAVAMMASSLLWPTLTRRYQKRQEKLAEIARQKKYKQYVDAKYRQLQLIAQSQKDALIDNNITLNECESIIVNKSHKLWERSPNHDDFLKVRLGLGTSLVNVEIDTDAEKFSMDDDSLLRYRNEAIAKSRVMTGVPITESFRDNNIVAIEGKDEKVDTFVRDLILQFITFHSYKDLKIMIITDNAYKKDWEFTRSLPHCWSDDRTVRFVATNSDEMKNLSFYAEQVLKQRMPQTEDDKKNTSAKDLESLKFISPYYLIITDNYKVARNLQVIQDIVNSSNNFGFGLMILGKNLSNVPAKCKSFISLGEKQSGLFESQLLANTQKLFIPDNAKYNLDKCARVLANIPIELSGGEYALPGTVSFLQMYKSGMVDQLNPLARWKKNNPVVSLSVPVGIGTNGELFKLDLHEKAHGPHGLIAGMTGSGKSEFIISYVLSLAVNFSPEEVQFVLIDYKGGGLAGAFENRETGMVLPHLVGTITNLDGSEIQRSLLSIQSELKRRQAMFNDARDKLNESTMDIYKYQRYYREGMLEDPISHLFLISDEFAELKAQEPEFMDELISTARIGRSLGVHLILATQKPSGVVNDQIWSNSRFRVCLKVQEAADSKEMIMRPDAAALKEAGRFYLQVGYDELFALGQSAWCGAPYIPSEKIVELVDDSIEFIDDSGNVIKTVNNIKLDNNKAKGEELPNILGFISEVAEMETFKIRKLWLDRIPNDIFISDLIKKYNYKSRPRYINPVIGEYDVPAEQEQYLLTLPISEVGNTYLVSVSGKDLFFQTLIYSLAISYTPEDVNIYALDFGADVLRSFLNIPQVGGVMSPSEEEKIVNFFRFIDEEIERRKHRLKDYHGDYKFFLDKSQDSMPMMIIIINNVEAFYETYPLYEDTIRRLSRDSTKYGIVFVVGANGENGLRATTRQNFNEKIAMELNDPYTYRFILGVSTRMQPSRAEGRGLVARGGEGHEFQTARMCPTEGVSQLIEAMSKELNAKFSKRAPRVPMLPDIVRLSDLDGFHQSLSQFGVAMNTENLSPILYDFTEKVCTPIVSAFLDGLKDFTQSLLEGLKLVPQTSFQFWDASREFEGITDAKCYVNQNFKAVFDQLHPYLTQQYQILQQNNMDLNSISQSEKIVIVATNFIDIMSSLSRDEQVMAQEVLKLASETKLVFFILIDGADSLKQGRYENWFQTYVDTKEGLYLGSNLNDTMFFKLSVTDRSLRDRLPNDYGYYIRRGVPTRCKFISSRSEVKDE